MSVATLHEQVVQKLLKNGEPQKYGREELNQLLITVYEEGVSDVLIQTGEPILISLQGDWVRVGSRPLLLSELQMLLTQTHTINAFAELISGKEQLYRYDVRKDRSSLYGFRCCAVQINSMNAGEHGVEIVMRAIAALPPPVESLQLEKELLQSIVPNTGLVLVTGPTGSGKSTLLAAVLRHILETPPGRHIITFENPVEFMLRNVPNRIGVVAQSEIPKALPSFAAGVANALRRKGEVILIGEAREIETIRALIEAAQTGHLVYSTVHTNDVASTITRMADSFGIEQAWPVALKLLDAVRLIVHQRLAPGVDGRRVAVREFLVFNEDIRRSLMAAGPNQLQLLMRQFVIEQGQSMVRCAQRLLTQGKILPAWVESLEAQYEAEAASLRKIAQNPTVTTHL